MKKFANLARKANTFGLSLLFSSAVPGMSPMLDISICMPIAAIELNAQEWFCEDMKFIQDNKLFNAYDEDAFSPERPLAKGKLAVALGKLGGFEASETANSGGDPSLHYIRWAEDNAIFPDGGLGDEITRGEMAEVLMNFAVFSGKGPVGSWAVRLDFVDIADIPDSSVEGAMWCSMNKIIVGRPGKVFDPKALATEAEAAAMIHRFAQLVGLSRA
jgi:hypothetical protein